MVLAYGKEGGDSTKMVTHYERKRDGGFTVQFDTEQLIWVNEPKEYSISEHKITLRTEPGTDFWQRTYYGFRNDNAPALLTKTSEPYFTFEVKTAFDSKRRFDQSGVIVYQDEENWFKASCEYENETYQRLGSVVTNHGYSDWATTDIPADHKVMYYRLSRRERDFLIEFSFDGVEYRQMRIFHLAAAKDEVRFGVYACSPEHSSFEAVFTDFRCGDCVWEEHR